MNNSSLDYDKMTDDEYFEVEEDYLKLKQPPTEVHNKDVIFAFTSEGEKNHRKLIKLLSKASKYGIIRKKIDLTKYKIIWKSEDGKLGLINISFKEWLQLIETGTMSSAPTGGVGDIAPYKLPVGFGIVRRKWPKEKGKKNERRNNN